MSVLRHALLGLLARSPQTGYDLSKAMSRRVPSGWAANHSQIYPELRKMADEGLIMVSPATGSGPRAARRLSITTSGLTALRDWVARPSEIVAVRDEFIVRVYSLWLLDPATAIDLVRTHRDLHADRLAEYQALTDDPAHVADPTAPEFAGRAALACALSHLRHRLDWLTWLLTELGSAPEPTAPHLDPTPDSPDGDPGGHPAQHRPAGSVETGNTARRRTD